MKYLLVLLVVGIGLWVLLKRVRGTGLKPPASPKTRLPQEMVECAHCGLHLPAADAVLEGRHVFCSDSHRLLGPRR
ncbi:PP0621 family protein [Aquabacterium sp.]|uniref:PP0621 family protein n=1 Tax=Aquabacterium sp. TaxID=1872578 RepID=UPI002CD61DC1|nr:PP0621 family protein [Aquabacterium sp.]HSW06125.1 PP0621 family protein [Aquabacterium sp.]